MSKPVEVTLFHAKWCVHCVNFMPTWKEIKSNKKATKNINFVDYEEEDIDALEDSIKTINGEQIEGFPTLKVSVLGNEYELPSNQRSENGIFRFIKDKVLELNKSSIDIEESTNMSNVNEMETETEEPMQTGGSKKTETDEPMQTGGSKKTETETDEPMQTGGEKSRNVIKVANFNIPQVNNLNNLEALLDMF